MAARLNLRQQEQTRSAIQATQLVKRLQCFALGEADDAGNTVDLDSNKLKAIEVLLRKALPDLSSVTLQGDEDNPVAVLSKIERLIVDPANTNSAGVSAAAKA